MRYLLVSHNWSWQGALRWIGVLLTVAILIGRGSAHLLAQEPQAVDLEALPDFVYGTSAIPPGKNYTTVTGRFITPNSLVLVTPDTTGLPTTATPVNSLKVISRFEGGFNVITSSRTNTGSNGAPFSWVVFNVRSSGPYRVGTGRIIAGRNSATVVDSAATTSSYIVLTADVSGILNDTATENLRVQERRQGEFTVATLNLSNRPTTDLPFTYLLVNDADCYVACRSAVASGDPSVALSTDNMNKTAAVFITPDVTDLPDRTVTVSDLKVRHRLAGFFRVATVSELSTSQRIPFNYIIFQPLPRWEELGPTGRSGNVWSIAVHPTAFATQYAGSSWGGVWKSADAGMTWRSTWNLAVQGIVRLAMAADNPNVLYAAARDGTVYRTQDAGATWISLDRPPGYDNFEGGSNGSSVFLASPLQGLVYLCTARGLHVWSILSPWTSVAPTAETSTRCTDVVSGPGNNLYAGFRESGVWQQHNGTWRKIKAAVGPITWNAGTKNEVTISDPIYRIAVGPTRIAILSECYLYLNNVSNLPAANVESTWTFRTTLCGTLPEEGSVYTYNGYVSAIAISPANENRLIAAGKHAYLSTDNGLSWTRVIHEGSGTVDSVDFHQIFFYPADPNKVVAVSDQGPRYSYNQGTGWFEAPLLDGLVDGPPVLEFYNLTVSDPDMFGRVWVGGHIQDIGGTYLAGSYSGFKGPEGEFGFSVVAPRPINLSGPLRSRFRTYTNSHDLTNPKSELVQCDFELAGPNYDVPTGQQRGYFGPSSPTCTEATFVPPLAEKDETIPSAIAVSPIRSDLLVVGNRQGDLYISRPGANGTILDQVDAGVTPTSAVTSLVFIASGKILAGFDNGEVYLVTTTFNSASTPTVAKLTAPDPVTDRTIIDFANKFGDDQELYVANAKDIFRSANGGTSWTRVTSSAATGGQFLANNLATGVQIVGLARDANYPFLYVATGQRRPLSDVHWRAANVGLPWVYRSPTPANGLWTSFGEGLPTRVPIVDIGVASNQALYLATQGRGIWWRRDVSAVPPNSGVNAPEAATVFVDVPVIVTTTCAHPDGWRNLHTLAFKLGEGLGAGDGAPFAMWVEYDEEANLVRFFDAATGETQSGTPGEDKILENEVVALDLANVTVGAIDPDKKIVQIRWALRFKEPSRAALFEQFLQVQDDAGNTTSWDEVGTVQVSQTGPTLVLPYIEK